MDSKNEKDKSYVLLKDIVIPRGTVFQSSPKSIHYLDSSHYETIIGLTDNTSGFVTYSIGEEDELSDVFVEVIE